METKFEVGKTYRYKPGKGSYLYRCFAISPNGLACVSSNGGSEFFICPKAFSSYEEYHEPVIVKKRIGIKREYCTSPLDIATDLFNRNYTVVELTWTDDKLTSAEIVRKAE